MYCTQADIIAARIDERTLLQLTDDQNSGSIDGTVTDSIIAEVSELIDGYLRGHYTLPLNPVPKLLTGIALDLCTERLYARRVALDTPDHVTRARKNALEMLRQIQLGNLRLGAAATEVESSHDSAVVSAPASIFTPEALEEF